MKFSIKDFFSKGDQIRSFLATFTEEILNGKLNFLCSVLLLLHGRVVKSLIWGHPFMTSAIFERLIYIAMFKQFLGNDLISSN